jgi:MYXO-CTERM domain-containing protein
MRRLFGAGLLLASLGSGRAALALEVETLRESGPIDKRFNIAVLGDGYRSQDQAKLTSDATSIISYLFGVSPLQQYAGFVNVKLIHVISNDNGGDNGAYGADRDTVLGARFNCNNIDRLLCVDGGTAQTLAAQDVPEFNYAVVIVNDTTYGGSGGNVPVSSSNSESFEVMSHEIAHSLADLADEYSYAGGIGPCDQQNDCREANVTVRNQRDQIKWRSWILDGTPVPTTPQNQYPNAIGLFEGARYQETGTYRPHFSCKMKDLGKEFCSVCSEQFVRSFWQFDNIQMIEATAPALDVQSGDCEPIELKVTTPPITPSTYRYTWTVDGQALPDMADPVQLSPGALMQGSHTVELLVEDTTTLVRDDPESLLEDEYSWSISVARSDCPAVVGGTAGAAGAGGGGAGGLAGMAGAAMGGIGGADAGAGGTAGGGAGGLPNGAAGSVMGAAVSPAPPPRDASGCGCSIPGDRSPPGPALALLAALAAAFGRRQVRRKTAARLASESARERDSRTSTLPPSR